MQATHIMQAPVFQQFVDRRSPQGGATSLRHPSAIQIIYNAEIRSFPYARQVCLCLMCRCYDRSRSFLYLRENSIETNEGATHICGCLAECILDVVACPLQLAWDCFHLFACCFTGCSAKTFLRSWYPFFKLADDNVSLVHFGRNFFHATTEGCCCVQINTPKLEVMDKGCMICCVRCPPCVNIVCPCCVGLEGCRRDAI